MTFEEKMAQAFKETSDERTDRLMKTEKKHKFSLAYKIWEIKTLRDLRRGRCDNRWTLQKARKTAMAMVTVFSILICGFTAYAASGLLGRYGFVKKFDYTKVLIETHPSDKASFEEYYGLPEEEWELKNYSFGSSSVWLFYRQDEKIVNMSQNLIEYDDFQVIPETSNVEMLSICSENDAFIFEYRKNEYILYWIYDGYLFHIYGTIDKNAMINLAHSIKIIDLEKNIQ